MNNFRDSAFNLYQKAVVAARSSILVKYGLPFGAMMVVSFILLRQSASVRYIFKTRVLGSFISKHLYIVDSKHFLN